jgi:hypothetical protein
VSQQKRKQDREWKRRNRTKRPDGRLYRRYTPEQWYACQSLLHEGYSIKEAARISGISYHMAWRISRGLFLFGRMPYKYPHEMVDKDL